LEAIEKDYQNELDKIKTLELQNNRNVEAQKVQAKINANNQILAVEKEKAAVNRRKALAQALTDYLIKQADERIAQIDKEIEAAEKQQDMLRQLAANGNITAKESLAENQRIIDEANRKKQEAEKQKQRILLANTAFQAYQSNVESDSKTPLADTIRDISLLQAFINSLPAFESGTENTGANGQGIDGRGGFLSVLHPYERVMDAENNAKVPANMSNSDLAQVAQDYDTGKLMRKGEAAVQIGGPWESAAVLARLQGVEDAIRSQDFGSELEKVGDHVAYLTTTRRRGSVTVKNRNRIQN